MFIIHFLDFNTITFSYFKTIISLRNVYFNKYIDIFSNEL